MKADSDEQETIQEQFQGKCGLEVGGQKAERGAREVLSFG